MFTGQVRAVLCFQWWHTHVEGHAAWRVDQVLVHLSNKTHTCTALSFSYPCNHKHRHSLYHSYAHNHKHIHVTVRRLSLRSLIICHNPPSWPPLRGRMTSQQGSYWCVHCVCVNQPLELIKYGCLVHCVRNSSTVGAATCWRVPDTATEGARFGSSWPSAPNTWLVLVRLSAQHFSFVPSLLFSLQSGLIYQM